MDTSNPGAAGGVEIAGVPLEFVLFALTLAGVALLHRHSLQVALVGLVSVVIYKLLATGFDGIAGFAGLAHHLRLEWVVLANLFGLLMGFALLSRHFEESGVPTRLPDFLPDDWRGCFVLLVIVFVLSSFLDNIAAALIGGAIAHTVFRGRVHVGYIAALVAASNAGGSGSVIGDTTTTMMWIDGVSPIDVLHAYVAAGVALLVFGVPAARQQQRYEPIARSAVAGVPVDGARLATVAFVLIVAIAVNVTINLYHPALAERWPFLGAAVWAALLLAAPLRQPDWSVLPATLRGTVFLLALVLSASLMPVEALPAPSWMTTLGPRVCVGGVRQHTAHQARADAGWLRLGDARVCGRLWRVDDLVRIIGGRRHHEPVSRGTLGRRLAPGRLARGARLRRRLSRAVPDAGLATAWTVSA